MGVIERVAELEAAPKVHYLQHQGKDCIQCFIKVS